jgi:hypothetical protein
VFLFICGDNVITPTLNTPTIITPTIITPTLNTSTVTDSLCNSGALKTIALYTKKTSDSGIKNHAPFKLNGQSRTAFGLLKAPELQRLSVTVEVLTVGDQYYTAGALQCLFSFRQKLLHSHSVELIGLIILCVFFPFRLLSVLHGLAAMLNIRLERKTETL